MTRDTVRDLQRAGCAEVWMGAESGSQRILDAMEKDISADEIRAACENVHAHGIRACLFLQFGYPGETWEDVQQTVAMVRAVRPDDVGISVSYPLPNTRLHELVRPRTTSKTNWTDSGDLEVMFRSTYTTNFYRLLIDAIHTEVRRGFHAAADVWESVEALEGVSRNTNPSLPLNISLPIFSGTVCAGN